MGFGSKAKQATTYTDQNGGSGKDIFFPSASGDKGASVERSFRMFADEDEVVYREWSGEVTVNGNKTFRSCVVAQDNFFDARSRARLAEIKEVAAKAGKSEEEIKELVKAENLKWTKQVFAVNVLNRDGNTVQVLKNTYEPHIEDEAGNLTPKNKMGGRTVYAKLMSLIKTGARGHDPKNPRKSVIVNDPSLFDIILVIAGQGLGKKYELHADIPTPIDPELLELPRYDIEGWAKGTGIWPNEALEKLSNGADYYKLVEEYKIALYPTLRETVQVETPVPVAVTEGDDDPLFAE